MFNVEDSLIPDELVNLVCNHCWDRSSWHAPLIAKMAAEGRVLKCPACGERDGVPAPAAVPSGER